MSIRILPTARYETGEKPATLGVAEKEAGYMSLADMEKELVKDRLIVVEGAEA